MQSPFKLTVGIVFQRKSEHYFQRILFVDEQADQICLIKFSLNRKETSLPTCYSYHDVLSDFRNQEIIVITPDPISLTSQGAEISASAKKIRDHAWNQIKDIVMMEPDIYSAPVRNALINQIVLLPKAASVPSIYKWLKMYWRGGMIPNALIPEFFKCGAKDIEKKTCKLSADLKKIIRKGYEKYYLNSENSLRDARSMTLSFLYKPEIHGREKFSLRQFEYWGKKGWTNSEIEERRTGRRSYQSNKRLLHGRATDIANGPGRLFQIDWTATDVHVVSSLNDNQYIGRPTLYVVVDTFSRVITGILLTFDNPSCIVLCNALYNACRDKVEFAKECGLEINENDWPTSFLPSAVIGDRGELLSEKANTIVNNLNITVQNTAAYRAELKSIVELMHGKIQERAKRLFENNGRVHKNFGQRLAKDSRKQATVTLNELYKITIMTTIEYNNLHIIEGYPLTQQMSFDMPDKIPMKIMTWGFEKGIGASKRTMDRETLWANLLYRIEVIPNRKGIKLNKQEYVPSRQEDFTLLSELIDAKQVKKITVSFDPRKYDEVYWIYRNRFIPLRLRGETDVRYSNLWEAIKTNEMYSERHKILKSLEEDVQIKNDQIIKSIIDKDSKNLKVKTKNVRLAKRIEVELEHSSNPLIKRAPVTSSTEPSAENKYQKPTYSTDLEAIDKHERRKFKK